MNDKIKTKELFVISQIKAEIKHQGFSYKTFAALFGKSGGWLGLLMTRKRKISIDVLFEIAEKLNIKPSSLLPDNNPHPGKQTLDEHFRFIVREEKEYFRSIAKEEIEKVLKNK